ncbi:MAG: hypothetical protein LKJ69_06975 [Lactobacillus sp.]|nr:hypothetical protein [Lactobacillus sp.]MCI2033132.1 hypothetical protein [Lactobacillus sp.]
MAVVDVRALQALRREVLANSEPANMGQVNGLITLGFRKFECHGFSSAYFRLSFWPQLVPLLQPAAQPQLAARFEALVQRG